MVKELTLVSKNLSTNIAALRRGRGLSQNGLARLAKVPRSTITYIESGASNPSLQNLVKIAGALQVSIEELLSRPRAACKLIKAQDIRSQRRAQGMATIFKLLPDPIPFMEIDRIRLEKQGRMGGVPHTAHTKEYLICLEGLIRLTIAGENFDLSKGDVLAFPGDQHHSYVNIGVGLAEGISVVVLAPHGV